MHELRLGNNLDILKEYPDNHFDSVVTDPPYGLGKEPDANLMLNAWLEYGYYEVKGKGFMNKEWDAFIPQPIFWKEVFRVLKPGGHIATFAGTRTQDLMGLALRLSGFEIRETIMWVFGSGFPKSLNVGKAVDKFLGNERTVLGIKSRPDGTQRQNMENWGYGKANDYGDGKGLYANKKSLLKANTLTQGNTEFEGYGTALKPAYEPIIIARKPLSEKSVAENYLKWGVGGLNIDDCRVETTEFAKAGSERKARFKDGEFLGKLGVKEIEYRGSGATHSNGRFPSNFIHDGSDEVIELFPMTQGESRTEKKNTGKNGKICFTNHKKGDKTVAYPEPAGSASRFFYCAKASKREREEGNHHPTVKPIKLMRYIARLVTPRNGLVLEPFLGSGTTGVACIKEGFDFVGIEQEQDYFQISEARIANAKKL
jgi:DNA modification methylase